MVDEYKIQAGETIYIPELGVHYTPPSSGIYKVTGNGPDLYIIHMSTNMDSYNTTDLEHWTSSKCECGANKTYAGYPNLEYLHSYWCPLYLDPNWLDKINKQEKNNKGE